MSLAVDILWVIIAALLGLIVGALGVLGYVVWRFGRMWNP